MSLNALVKDLKETTIPLEHIYLDPNNPRFVSQNWISVPDAEIHLEAIQDNTRQRMLNDFSIEKLRMNMEVNGYLPIDRVIVRAFETDKYVVLEGNRRICAAKLISDIAMDGTRVSAEVRASVESIPCLVYVGTDSRAAWIFQGLRHITGYEDWSAFNKAKLLVEQMEEEDLDLSNVGQRFGLTPYGAGQWVRGYYAYKQARERSDYMIEVDERSYPYFQELFSRSNARIREWMDWDNDKYQFKNEMNLNEFVSWLYPKSNLDEIDGNETGKGDWERRILKNRDDIRHLSFLLQEEPQTFEIFRQERDVESAYVQALTKKLERRAREKSDAAEQVFVVLNECIKTLDEIPFKLVRNQAYRQRLLEQIARLESVIQPLKQ